MNTLLTIWLVLGGFIGGFVQLMMDYLDSSDLTSYSNHRDLDRNCIALIRTIKERIVRMSFNDAVLAMKQGKRVRMPWWGGYWYIANGTLRIHCADDHDFNAFSEENADPLYTLSFMTANCWEVVTDF